MSKKKAIGIDLGTSKCCVGVVRDGKVEILENERGNKTTPSYVAFTDTERLVGEDAKDQATLNPTNTVFGVKRIIGRELKDALLDKAIDKMPYTIMNNDETCINVSYKDIEEYLLPQQITAMLLSKMKDLAEHHLRRKVEEAVISVPASFTNAQRQATKDSAAIAGLKVLALINEPTAAAIAYGANRRTTDEENVAIVNFGAGNLDVAIATVRKGRVSVRAVGGSTAIGGNDIDEVLMEFVGSKFKEKRGQSLPESPALTERLRSCCEKLKRKLTFLPKVQETLDCFGDDNVLPVNITRNHFDSMIPLEMQSSLKNYLDRAMQTSRIALEDISRVVLVGGSSRVPLFQTWLEEIFGQNSLDKSVNPDEAVACGAAWYAALLSGDNELEEFTVKESVPNNISFSMGDSDIQHVFFEQHSSKTLTQRRVYQFNGQSPFNEKTRAQTFELFEELSGQKNPHRLIGTLCLDNEFSKAVSLITNITFEIDSCGIFNALVQLRPNHIFSEVVKNYAGKLSKNKLQNAIERERLFRRDDQDEKERVEAMSSLEALSYRPQSAMNDSKTKELFPELVKQIADNAQENIQWLDTTNTVLKAECVKRQNKLGKLKDELEIKIKQHEKEEKDRLTAVTNLESYCSFLGTLFSTGMADETELVAALGEQLKKATEWLKSSERPSKVDCDNTTDTMKKIHAEIKQKLETERREDERRAAVDDLHKYCSKLRDIKFETKEFDFISYDVRRLNEENESCMKYIAEITFPSKAECDLRKQRLEKMECEVEKRVAQEKARQLQSKRRAAKTRLRSLCTDLGYLARTIPKSDIEGCGMATLASEACKETLKILNDFKTTNEQYDAQQKIIENYLKTLDDHLKDLDRLACLECCKSRWSYIEQTMLIEIIRKQELELCNDVMQKKEALFLCLETDNFSKRDYDKKRATFETSVGTLKNIIRRKYSKLFSG